MLSVFAEMFSFCQFLCVLQVKTYLIFKTLYKLDCFSICPPHIIPKSLLFFNFIFSVFTLLVIQTSTKKCLCCAVQSPFTSLSFSMSGTMTSLLCLLVCDLYTLKFTLFLFTVLCLDNCIQWCSQHQHEDIVLYFFTPKTLCHFVR